MIRKIKHHVRTHKHRYAFGSLAAIGLLIASLYFFYGCGANPTGVYYPDIGAYRITNYPGTLWDTHPLSRRYDPVYRRLHWSTPGITTFEWTGGP